MNLTVCQSNTNVLKAKTVNVVSDGSNIVCVSCGKDVFMLSHEKYVARYALSVDSRVKRALFTSPVASKSRTLGATKVVVKSKFSFAKTLTTTNKVSSAPSLSPDSNQSKRLSNYMKIKLQQEESGRNGLNINKVLIGHPRVIQLILWIIDSGCSKHMTSNLKLLRNFIEKFMGTVHFGNDHSSLGHNLFSVRQFCDGDLELAFRSNTCYVRNLEGEDVLTDYRNYNLYTISISDLTASSPVCLMSKAISTKSWYNKTPYEMIKGRKPNVQYFYVFGSLEKRVMYLAEIVKFCNATLERVLKEVKLKIFKSGPWKKPPLMGELDRDILTAYEREISKRLRHRVQMRRWKSFVNRRPILHNQPLRGDC
ncbi:hypothetical protein Tco_0412892 [Tanacetum coccineum]